MAKSKKQKPLANPSAALVSAIEKEDFSRIEFLFTDTKTKVDYEESKPLKAAVIKGNLRIVEILINKGASINTEAMSEILAEAVKQKSEDIWQYFINQQVDFKNYGYPAFIEAVEQEDYEKIEFLVAQGFDPEKKTGENIIRRSILKGSRANIDAKEALIKAIIKGNLEMVRYLIENLKIDIKQYYEAVLTKTSPYINLRILQYFSDQGINVRLKKFNILYHALKNERADIIEFFEGYVVDIQQHNSKKENSVYSS
jgi:ankyrin repeat protein